MIQKRGGGGRKEEEEDFKSTAYGLNLKEDLKKYTLLVKSN